MNLSPLQAISPVDGRYRKTTSKLADYFSESALIKYRIFVEIEYFIALCDAKISGLETFDSNLYPQLRSIYQNFNDNDAQQVKDQLMSLKTQEKSIEINNGGTIEIGGDNE